MLAYQVIASHQFSIWSKGGITAYDVTPTYEAPAQLNPTFCFDKTWFHSSN